MEYFVQLMDIYKDEALYYYNDAFNDGINEIAHNNGYYYSLITSSLNKSLI